VDVGEFIDYQSGRADNSEGLRRFAVHEFGAQLNRQRTVAVMHGPHAAADPLSCLKDHGTQPGLREVTSGR
jgi:hypothetical protein